MLLSGPSLAQDKPKAEPQKGTSKILSGVPVVQESGCLTLNGKTIELWGIDRLAPDQQCWQGDVAWFCGEQSTIALRHFVEGRILNCEVQQIPDNGPLLARCYRQKGKERKDISGILVSHGWAMDKGETSGGAYFAAEEEAKKDKRGIWGSRFQSAEDWKEGVQRYLNDPDHEPPAAEEKNEEDSGEGD